MWDNRKQIGMAPVYYEMEVTVPALSKRRQQFTFGPVIFVGGVLTFPQFMSYITVKGIILHLRNNLTTFLTTRAYNVTILSVYIYILIYIILYGILLATTIGIIWCLLTSNNTLLVTFYFLSPCIIAYVLWITLCSLMNIQM